MLLPSTCFLACARDARVTCAIDAPSRERAPRLRRPLVTLSGYETPSTRRCTSKRRGDDATLRWWRKTLQRAEEVPRVLELGVARAQALLFRILGHRVLELRLIRGLLERDHGLGREDVEARRRAAAVSQGLGRQ